MTAPIVLVFILSLLLQVSHSLPVLLDVKTVQSTDSVPESGLTERTAVLDSQTVIRLEEDNKLVRSLSKETLLKAFEGFEADLGKRIKRHITRAKKLCSSDTIEHAGLCVPKKKYEEYYDDYGSSDYKAER